MLEHPKLADGTPARHVQRSKAMSRSVSRRRCWHGGVSELSRVLAICGLLTLGRALPVAAAPVTPPDTPAGHALADWLDAFNSADETRMNAYLDKYQTTTRLGQQIPFRLATGGFDLTAIRESEPRRI